MKHALLGKRPSLIVTGRPSIIVATLIQRPSVGLSERPLARTLPALTVSVTDRRAVYLAGTYRSVGKGWS
jgi:hypothetical protein